MIDFATSADVNVEAGLVPLGPSKNSPVPLATISNYNDRSWFTLENTLALPVLVSSVQQGSGIQTNVGAGLTIPAFTRATVPVAPNSDVLLTCLGQGQWLDMAQWDGGNIFSNMAQGTWKQRNLQYLLHDNGSMYQSSLLGNPIQLGGGFGSNAANTTELYFVAPNLQYGGANVNWIWTGSSLHMPQDAFLTHVSIGLDSSGPACAPDNLRIRVAYDFDTTVPRHTSFTAGVAAFAGAAVGSAGYNVVMYCPGAIAFAVQSFDAAAQGFVYDYRAWGIIPAQ